MDGSAQVHDDRLAGGEPVAGQALLTIREAAALLNVSMVSLRRWTDAGILPCVRVGARRERRFRREDLLALPDSRRDKRLAARTVPSGGAKARVEIEGLSIDYSTHLCALYETDAGRTKLAIPFLAEGLRRGDACFLVAAAPAVQHLLEHLRAAEPGVAAALRSGQLRVWNGFESVAATLDAFEAGFLEASRKSVPGIRVVGDMAWFFEQDMSFDELERFEICYNHRLAHRFAAVSLCLYDVREFSGRHVLGALKCHEDTFKYPLARFLGP